MLRAAAAATAGTEGNLGPHHYVIAYKGAATGRDFLDPQLDSGAVIAPQTEAVFMLQTELLAASSKSSTSVRTTSVLDMASE